MRLEFFQAADGDSFLLTSDGHHLLVDGGRKTSFDDHVLPSLDAIRSRGERIDAVCVSHIDADHITGILALLDQMVEWRIYDYHQNTIQDADYPAPSPLRPPEIGKVWHNGFAQQLGADPGLALDMLRSTALILASSTRYTIRQAAEALGGLASSIPQGIQLAQRLDTQQLDIPINPEFGGGMMITGAGLQLLTIGAATFGLLGPTVAQITDLREEWAAWVADNQDKVEQLNRESQRDADRLGLAAADAYFELRALRAQTLADRGKVTVPNLASIMLFVREGNRTAILTGDGFGDDIITGLKALGELTPAGLHVDVFKVPHHGSEHNSDQTLYKQITADQYVIPSDGSNNNPDVRVVDDILRSRVGRRSRQTLTQQAANPFTIRITAEPGPKDSDKAKHLRAVQTLIRQWQRRYPDHIRFEFLAASSFIIDLA